MGGKGRGVFSDFRMGRVCHGILFGRRRADDPIVSISRKRSRGKPTGREESKLVGVLLREPDCFHVQYCEASIAPMSHTYFWHYIWPCT